MKNTSIVNCYQAVIFYHNVKGLPVAGWSDMDSYYMLSIWTIILFLFKTLLGVSHVVTSPHTLLVKDIVFTSWGMIVNITSSKTLTIQWGKPHQIPVSSIENKALCPVYLLNFFLIIP